MALKEKNNIHHYILFEHHSLEIATSSCDNLSKNMLHSYYIPLTARFVSDIFFSGEH